MTAKSAGPPEVTTTRRTGGSQNLRILGFDIHRTVFPVSAVLAITLLGATLLFLDQAAATFSTLRSLLTSTFDWFFMVAANLFVLICVAIAVSPLGRIRLGGGDAVPAYGYTAWLAMLFAAGVSIGLMFFGVLEPVTHALAPPLGIDPASEDAARVLGMSAAILHWGLHPWAIYAVAGLAIAYFCFNRGMPLTLRSSFYPLLGARVWGPFGHCVDVAAVLATLFGLAVSLGYGAEQIAGGLEYLFDVPATVTSRTLIIALIIAVSILSVIAGLDRGIKRLSWINMSLAGLLLLFVLCVGPTLVVFETAVNSVVGYVRNLPAFSNWIGREDDAFLQGWTVFYWAWWISWAPFVGMFIARISYGRTVREFIVFVLLVPTAIGIAWMSTFGGTALEQHFAQGYTGVAESVPELALFRMLEPLPLTGIVSTVSVLLVVLFFVTSLDSGSLVMDVLAAGGKVDAPAPQRVFWCVLAGSVAMALVVAGGTASFQAMAISVGLPFAAVLLFMCAGLIKGMLEDHSAQSGGPS